MPRYFFDFHSRTTLRDNVGSDLPSDEAARVEAFRALPRIATDELAKVENDRHHFAMEVRREDGRGVYVVTLSLAGIRLGR